MQKFSKKISITSRPLRLQLIIAFCLMSVIPLLALLNFIFPSLFPKAPLGVVIVVVMILMALGFVLIKRIIDSILEITSEVKIIAKGELSRKIDIVRDDEIGELSSALNQLTQRIKNHMDELNIYGERTKDINLQVNKQVIALSGLLQISNLIAKGAELKDIFEITMARLAQVANSSQAFLVFQNEENFSVKAQFGLSDEALSDIESSGNTYLFKGICSDKPFLKIDKISSDVAAGELLRVLKVKNVLVYPIMVQKKFKGLLGMGNHVSDFEYTGDDVELLNIFAKQLAIAVENDLLVHRVEDLEVRDSLTGLYNRRYITARLEEEVLRAISHQWPCAFIIVKIKNLKDIQFQSGEQTVEEDLKKVAAELKACGGEIDRVGRIGNDEFGIVLPEKNKRRAQDLALVIKDKVESVFAGVERRKKPEIQTSVVENPIDGTDAVSLIEKAKKNLEVGEGGL